MRSLPSIMQMAAENKFRSVSSKRLKDFMKRLCALSLAFFTQASAFATDPGSTAANFLKLGIGPRAIAMGKAQVGLADDVYAVYWTPAGLSQLKTQEAGFVQTQYLE